VSDPAHAVDCGRRAEGLRVCEPGPKLGSSESGLARFGQEQGGRLGYYRTVVVRRTRVLPAKSGGEGLEKGVVG